MSPSATSVCAEKERLTRAYTVAAGDFSRSVQVLAKFLGVMHKTEYERLRQYSEQARIQADEARLALERHMSEHGC